MVFRKRVFRLRSYISHISDKKYDGWDRLSGEYTEVLHTYKTWGAYKRISFWVLKSREKHISPSYMVVKLVKRAQK